jgi:hypothetical protein
MPPSRLRRASQPEVSLAAAIMDHVNPAQMTGSKESMKYPRRISPVSMARRRISRTMSSDTSQDHPSAVLKATTRTALPY